MSLYQLRFTLMDSYKWDMEYMDQMRMWEFETYVELLKQKMEKEEQERNKQ